MLFTTKPLKVVKESFSEPIETFLEHGKHIGMYNNLSRPTLFIRYIGMKKDKSDYESQVKRIDDYFFKEINTPYLRLAGFGYMPSPDQVVKYINIYEKYLEVQNARAELLFKVKFPACFQNEVLEWTMKCAFDKVLKFYKTHTKNINASTTKNFAVKLLAWIGHYLPCLIKEPLVRQPKIVYTGSIKKQEILFLYFLYLMGCDVLYMSAKEDIHLLYAECDSFSTLWSEPVRSEEDIMVMTFEAYKNERNKTHTSLRIGETVDSPSTRRGSIDLRRVSREGTNSIGRTQGAPPSISETNAHYTPQRAKPPSHNSIMPQQPPSTNNRLSTNSSQKLGERKVGRADRPLSYEELAQLSTSIVMIKVLDSTGKVFKGGSGVVIHQAGYILTNFHVVRDGRRYEVMFEGEECTYSTTRIIKYHPNYDLAVIKVDKLCKPIPLYRKDKQLVRGQKVVAIGSPLGLFNTVSDGIISAFRQLGDMSMIQFTAPISNGSSGGALLDLYGRLIGIITAGFDKGQNLNLAVNSELIIQFANSFL